MRSDSMMDTFLRYSTSQSGESRSEPSQVFVMTLIQQSHIPLQHFCNMKIFSCSRSWESIFRAYVD